MKIPEQAVRAALDVIHPNGWELSQRICLEKALTAAHPHLALSGTKPVDVAAVQNSEALFELNKFSTWFDRFICDQDELTSSTPRKVSQNAQDAAVMLKEAIRALSAEPAQAEQSGRAALEQGGGE